MTKTKNNKKETPQVTNDSVAKKIYQGIKKAGIKMGDPENISGNEIQEGQRWTSQKLDTGATVIFEKSIKKGGTNPRYLLKLVHNKKTLSFSGKYARATFKKLTHIPKVRNTALSAEEVALTKDALKGF